MPYNVDQLIADFRSDVYDRADVDASGTPRDTLWSPEDVLRYANSALAQWARDTLFVRRNMSVPVVAGKARYYAGNEVLEIIRAGLVLGTDPTARPRNLVKFDLDGGCISDDYGLMYFTAFDIDNRRGPGRGITFDYDPSYLRLYPIPDETGWLHMTLAVYPTPVQCGMPLPSDNPRDIHLLLLWMKYLAYGKQDADTLDLDRSQSFYNQYRNQVIDRLHEVDHTRRDAGVMRPRW